MTYSLCIDIGGTFTDCMVSDADGALQLFKAPSTPEGSARSGGTAPRSRRSLAPRTG